MLLRARQTVSGGRPHRPSASSDGTTGEPVPFVKPAGEQLVIGSAVLLGGCAALYLGRTVTGGYAFAVGASVGSIGRRPVVVRESLRNVVRSTAGRPLAKRRRSRRGRSWSRSA
jgi:hypothetical protein